MKAPNRIRVIRAEKQMKQIVLASRTHINQSRLSLLEHGYVDATKEEKRAIARAFRLPIADVFPELDQAVSA